MRSGATARLARANGGLLAKAAFVLVAAMILLALGGTNAFASDGKIVVRAHHPIFDVSRLVPGDAVSGRVVIENQSPYKTALQLKALKVVSDDNGCTPPERRVDKTCGRGQGELAEQMIFRIARKQVGGQYKHIWTGRLSDLSSGVVLIRRIGAGDSVDLRLTGLLPQQSGNETQSDGLGFSLRWTLESVEGDDSAVVLGTTYERPGGAGGLSGAVERVTRVLALTLPRTGVPLAALVIAGLGALVVGGVLLRLSRRQPVLED